MFHVQRLLGSLAIAIAFALPPMLVPGSRDLQTATITDRCDSVWFVARSPGDTSEHTLLGQRQEQHVVRGTVVQVTTLSTPDGSLIDSTILVRDGLTPISEVAHTGSQVIRYRYDRNRVELTTDSVQRHEYAHPLFNFDELDLVMRSLPLRPGYQALLPLYSEGDQDAEVDTALVEGKDSAGVWQVRFADKAIVATYGIAADTRQLVSYSHRFRADGPRWTAGTVWREAFHACGPRTAAAIVGGTVVDVSHFGKSTNDIADAVVLMDGGRITAVGPSAQITIPKGVTRIDAHGKFLIPGLIDGFGALRNQSFANAYLYDGVTTVYVATILPDGGGDGELKILRDAKPGPRLFLGAPMTGYSEDGRDPSDKPMTDHRLHDTRLSNQQLIARVDRLADQGFRGITISYDVWPDQVDVIVSQAKRRGLAIFAEPAFTTYPYAIRAGVDALLRNDHYQMALAPAATQLARADNLAAGAAAFRALCSTDTTSPAVSELGDQLTNSSTALMPTLALEAVADSLDVPNPWTAPSAAIIDAADLDTPVDRATGASGWLASVAPARRQPVRQCGWHKEALDARLYHLGAKFLAGTLAPSYGVMPGSGERLEISLFQRIGLSPREAIAAATSNFADVFGWPDVGRIEVGRNADVVVLDADPRADTTALTHIDTVILAGAVVQRPELLRPAH